ncbi:NAD(P)/FAD-dependent oxidoreductase [Naasia lichenicola]|uniref:NAD(P)/FAD-dependent oxidoreductase n=1 Tax=Naasia lichenicola TaxID=2565933 RepID=A0A4S4FES7_9MICO|nr:NAD(P)/FAD-dependent oxidoreductase [Naasia lichenicola]THG28611.1 NAD(P)/FAD-dependent oxidoreductase [Naasia lichenicola]
MSVRRFDVLVAGGGPVGLSAAIRARLSGLTVALVEPRSGPIDKACGEGLMPGAIDALAAIGVSPPGMPIAGFRYTDGRRTVSHRLTRAPGRGVRRLALSELLEARADEVGVERLVGRVEDIEQDDRTVHAAGLEARWMLACDGLHSGIRRTLGLARPSTAPRRFGIRQHFAVAPWTDLVEVHWSAGIEAYVTPVAPDVVGIGILGPPRTDFRAAIESLPELAGRLDGAAPASSVRGAGPLRQRTSARSAGRVLLVGDASGYVDALTGEGMRVGLAQAEAAVDAVLADSAEGYGREWAHRSRDFRVITGLMVAAATSPLRGAIVPTASALPAAFGAVIERLAR